MVVNGQTLKAGDYKVQFSDNKATIQQGKKVTEVPVKVENQRRQIFRNLRPFERDAGGRNPSGRHQHQAGL